MTAASNNCGRQEVHLGTLSEIPGGGSVAVFVEAGHAVRVRHTPGTQTVDTPKTRRSCPSTSSGRRYCSNPPRVHRRGNPCQRWTRCACRFLCAEVSSLTASSASRCVPENCYHCV